MNTKTKKKKTDVCKHHCCACVYKLLCFTRNLFGSTKAILLVFSNISGGYEEFGGTMECPTCRGEGRIPRGNSPVLPWVTLWRSLSRDLQDRTRISVHQVKKCFCCKSFGGGKIYSLQQFSISGGNFSDPWILTCPRLLPKHVQNNFLLGTSF